VTREIVGHRRVELAAENDPLEALWLGTYFGTCLGLGGGLTYSAAAIALDVNKQVVYARDTSGTILARQVLAIAEDDRLVCYLVYPRNARIELRDAFRNYDLRLAEALGISIYDPDAEPQCPEPEVASILSRSFWDDGAWNLDIQQGAVEKPVRCSSMRSRTRVALRGDILKGAVRANIDSFPNTDSRCGEQTEAH
jgi:hypothetical protein